MRTTSYRQDEIATDAATEVWLNSRKGIVVDMTAAQCIVARRLRVAEQRRTELTRRLIQSHGMERASVNPSVLDAMVARETLDTLSPEMRTIAVELQAGTSQVDIAQQLGVSQQTISNKLAKMVGEIGE